MADLPTRTTASTAAEHVGDHNNLHAFHNLIDAAGDLIVGTGVDTAGKLAKGAAETVLRVNAAGTALEYFDANAAYVAKGDVTGGLVSTSESTTSTTFSDLATVGPVVTVLVGTSGKVLVAISVQARHSTTTDFGLAAVAVTGATTRAAVDDEGIGLQNSAVDMFTWPARTYVLSGLTPGSNTFTLKYRVGGGSATFSRRTLIVIPL